jgi:hypothetical protein
MRSFNYNQIWLIAVIVTLCVFLGFTAPRAQTKAGDKEWAGVVEAAKKEGKVVVAGSPDPVMRNEVIPKFTARFGVPVEFVAGRSSQIVSRVETERASGIYSIDVFLAGPDTSANELYNDKMIDPLKPLLVMPEVADDSKELAVRDVELPMPIVGVLSAGNDHRAVLPICGHRGHARLRRLGTTRRIGEQELQTHNRNRGRSDDHDKRSEECERPRLAQTARE